MAHVFRYAILQLVPFSHRGEAINVGIAIFRDTELQVRLSAPPALLSFFGVQSSTLDWLTENLIKLDDPSASVEDRAAELTRFSGIKASDIGWFSTDEESQYEIRISEIIREYVDKPKIQKIKKERKSLVKDIKGVFRNYDIFGKSASDLDRHKIVANMPVGPSGKLHVDFLLKNGAFHATETIDFRSSEDAGPAELKNAALANVTFQHARDVLGHHRTQCYLVYAASSIVESAVAPAIEIASRDVTGAFNIESRDDKARYFELMLDAAGVNHLFRSHLAD